MTRKCLLAAVALVAAVTGEWVASTCAGHHLFIIFKQHEAPANPAAVIGNIVYN